MKEEQISVIGNNFSIGQLVYLRHDVEQFQRMITGILIRRDTLLYELSCGAEVSNHFSFEISIEKTVF